MARKKCICLEMVRSNSSEKTFNCPVHGYQHDPGCYLSQTSEPKIPKSYLRKMFQKLFPNLSKARKSQK